MHIFKINIKNKKNSSIILKMIKNIVIFHCFLDPERKIHLLYCHK